MQILLYRLCDSKKCRINVKHLPIWLTKCLTLVLKNAETPINLTANNNCANWLRKLRMFQSIQFDFNNISQFDFNKVKFLKNKKSTNLNQFDIKNAKFLAIRTHTFGFKDPPISLQKLENCIQPVQLKIYLSIQLRAGPLRGSAYAIAMGSVGLKGARKRISLKAKRPVKN